VEIDGVLLTMIPKHGR